MHQYDFINRIIYGFYKLAFLHIYVRQAINVNEELAPNIYLNLTIL